MNGKWKRGIVPPNIEHVSFYQRDSEWKYVYPGYPFFEPTIMIYFHRSNPLLHLYTCGDPVEIEWRNQHVIVVTFRVREDRMSYLADAPVDFDTDIGKVSIYSMLTRTVEDITVSDLSHHLPIPRHLFQSVALGITREEIDGTLMDWVGEPRSMGKFIETLVINAVKGKWKHNNMARRIVKTLRRLGFLKSTRGDNLIQTGVTVSNYSELYGMYLSGRFDLYIGSTNTLVEIKACINPMDTPYHLRQVLLYRHILTLFPNAFTVDRVVIINPIQDCLVFVDRFPQELEDGYPSFPT